LCNGIHQDIRYNEYYQADHQVAAKHILSQDRSSRS
jgi:hypothetical protein